MNSLICITTCNRINEVKKYILPYIDFCNKHEGFDFLLSLDGNTENYKSFCDKFKIPLLHSEEREGVGLAKNRVLSSFPEYDYYFFVEDDMELLDSKIFITCIDFSNKQNIPHLSYTVFGESTSLIMRDEWQYLQGFRSGAQFSFFEAKALFKVGGWNTLFAKYKRFGHSEHSYRFFNNGFQDYPFIALTSTADSLILHDPPHVTVIENEGLFDHYHPEEKHLIESKTLYFPISTISPFYFNGFDMNFNSIVEEFLRTNKRRYPLTVGKNRRIALAEYYFEMFLRHRNIYFKIKNLFLSLINKPFNNPFKHFLKTKLHFK
jgi:hypothetical protein